VDTVEVTIITENVGGVSIYVDGEFVGITGDNPWIPANYRRLTFRIPVGTHNITLSRPGFQTVDQTNTFTIDIHRQELRWHMHPVQNTIFGP
jgi:hypothetical protein